MPNLLRQSTRIFIWHTTLDLPPWLRISLRTAKSLNNPLRPNFSLKPATCGLSLSACFETRENLIADEGTSAFATIVLQSAIIFVYGFFGLYGSDSGSRMAESSVRRPVFGLLIPLYRFLSTFFLSICPSLSLDGRHHYQRHIYDVDNDDVGTAFSRVVDLLLLESGSDSIADPRLSLHRWPLVQKRETVPVLSWNPFHEWWCDARWSAISSGVMWLTCVFRSALSGHFNLHLKHSEPPTVAESSCGVRVEPHLFGPGRARSAAAEYAENRQQQSWVGSDRRERQTKARFWDSIRFVLPMLGSSLVRIGSRLQTAVSCKLICTGWAGSRVLDGRAVATGQRESNRQ